MCWVRLSLVNLFTGFLILTTHITEGNRSKELLPVVKTALGEVRGYVSVSKDKRLFYAFKAIPFAKPPVGDLRFKAPVSPEPWEGILDATKDAPMCIQKNYFFYKVPAVEGKEDCLYLNVYTPKLPEESQTNTLLPVMVYIHTGGFSAASGNTDYSGPEYFMDKDVVMVTLNYRLGVFGFLSTNDDASPGNWGLKDQVAALRWIQNNIHVFGGDNRNVTIFGQCAGAVSVHLHMFSPNTEGLFHRAISQSGSALNFWARPNNKVQVQVAKVQAKFVNCDPKTDTQTMVDCIRKVDAVTLAETAARFKLFSYEPLIVFLPVIETKSLLNPEPYLTEDPLNLLLAGSFHKVPWIVGVAAEEGLMRVSRFLRNSEILDELNTKFNIYGSLMLSLASSVPSQEVANTWKKTVNYYLPEDSVNTTNPNSVQGFINMHGDRLFIYGTYQSALLHAWKGLNTVWFYRFDYRGEYSYADLFAATTEDINFKWGTSHCDDLIYLITSSRMFNPLKSKKDLQMVDALIQMWTDFAIKGNPSPNNTVAVQEWDPLPNLKERKTVKNLDLTYLSIVGSYDSEETVPAFFEMRNDFLTERMHFWQSLPLAENIKGLE